jgi:hypothetical protein
MIIPVLTGRSGFLQLKPGSHVNPWSHNFYDLFCPAVGDQGSLRLYLVRVRRGIILMPSRRKISSRASKT